MHELGLCASIVEAIERRAGERRVVGVTVRVGHRLHVHPEAFDQSFALAAEGTVAEGATARLLLVPAVGRCRACGATWESAEPDEPVIICPTCGGTDVEATGGHDLVLESIEYQS